MNQADSSCWQAILYRYPSVKVESTREMKRKSLLNLCLLAIVLLTMCAGSRAAAQEPPDFPPPHHHPHGAPPEPSHSVNHMPGEQVDATHIGAPVPLTNGWRVGVSGDQASDPSFDDSGWAIRDASESIADVDEDSDSGKNDNGPRRGPHDFVWFRLHIRLAPKPGPLALLIEVPVKGGASLSGVGPLR